MKITKQEAVWIAATLTQKAEKLVEQNGPGSVVAPTLEAVAKALRRGETLEIKG